MKRIIFTICTLLAFYSASYAQNCRANYMYFANAANPLAIEFVDSSFVTNGGHVGSWTWDFGDGHTSHDQSPTHTFSTAGDYGVCLTIRDTFNGITCSNTFCDTVTAGSVPATCSVGYQYTAGANLGQINFFSYTSGTNLTYAWSFGDGGTGASINPVHSYTANGRYRACVVITAHDNAGNAVCTSSFCDSVTVSNVTTTCSATYTDSISGSTGYFYATTTGHNPTYNWYFGDNTSSGPGAFATTHHSYTSPGRYQVCVFAYAHDSAGNITCTSSRCDSITIAANPPVCAASFQISSTNNLTATFASTSTGVTSNTTYHWNFGDSTDASGSTASHTYNHAGTYNVCLTITTATGGAIICTNQYCHTVTVTSPTPTCSVGFQYTQSPTTGAINFTASASGTNISYNWDFGDGYTAGPLTTNTTSHVFPAAGIFVVNVTIEAHDSLGHVICTAGTFDSVEVHSITPNHACHASFAYILSSTTSGTSAHFTNASTGASNTTQTYYSWSFGDSTFSHLFDPTHAYATPGTYHVCLTISTYGAAGALLCSDDTCLTVTITAPNPVACHSAFQYTASATNANELHFQEYATGTNLTYAWDFGDGHGATTHDPIHTYANAGYYLVCLTITNATGTTILCTDTYCDTIRIGSPSVTHCNASFTHMQSSVSGNAIHFVSTSTGAGTLSYQWTFGDGSSSTNFDPLHTYAHSGAYQVCLTIIDHSATGAATCTSQICDSIYAGSNIPTGPYTVSGTVFNGLYHNSVNAIVYLITLDSFDLIAIDSVLAPQGLYTFNNVRGGQYLIKAALRSGAPDYSSFLPTYYGDELFWLDASLLTVTQNTSSVDIHLQHGVNNGGPGFVGGNIFQGANKAGDPLANFQVMLLNMDNTPVQYTYSDASGAFNFSNIAYGTYQLYTEVLGLPTQPAIVTIAPTTETDNVHILVNSDVVTYERVTGIDNISSTITNTVLFPNPVTTSATVRFTAANEGVVSISLTNIIGQQMLESKTNALAGSNEVKVDMSGMASGIYILQLKDTNSKGAIFKIIKE